MRARSRPWLPALLVLAATAALWLLAGRQPAAWPEAEWSWSMHVDAVSPATAVIDRANDLAAWSPDLPVASLLLVLVFVLLLYATLDALGLPLGLSLGVALSAAFVRATWSTTASGLDARPLVVTGLAVLAVARAESPWLGPLAAVASLALSPLSAWLVLPALLLGRGSRLRRGFSAVTLLVAALGLRTWQFSAAWDTASCLSPGAASAALIDVLRPGRLIDISPWWSLQYTASVLRDDVHAFGLALAAVGLLGTAAPRRLRSATLLALLAGAFASLTGVVPPARVAALLVPWILPWLALGLTTLTGRPSRARTLAIASAGVAIVLIPVLRHATVIPGPWRSDSPAIARAVGGSWHGATVVSDDAAWVRRLQLVGIPTIPAEPSTIAACAATGREVLALGPMVRRAQAFGFVGLEASLEAPIAAMLGDLRQGAIVALALAPGTLPFAGPAGLRALADAGLPRSAGARDAVGLITRMGSGGESRQGHGGVDVSLQEGAMVGGAPLRASWSASAGDGDTDVDRPPTRLASSRHASIVVLDRAQDVVLRAAGAARAGLPFPLRTHPLWRPVRLVGPRTCQAAGREWTTLPAHQYLSLPVVGASGARPVLAYLVTTEPPALAVRGLPAPPGRQSWTGATFDRELPADLVRLESALGDDDVPATTLGAGRFVTRLSIHPSVPLLEGHASVNPGARPQRWIVRLAANATRALHTDVCAMADGPRVLDGQAGLVDDETSRELTVTTRDGWHATEYVRGSALQWTARPVATATFRAEPTRDLVIALEAVGADVGGVPQPVTVRVNGHIVKEGWRGAGQVSVAAALLVPGVNVLALEVPQVVRPTGDARPLGVLVRQLRVIRPSS